MRRSISTSLVGFVVLLSAGCSGGGSGIPIASAVAAPTQSLVSAQAQSSAQAAPLTQESAVSTTAFIDSIGMNAHFESPAYSQNYTQVHSLVANLGVRHYRVSAGNILSQPGYLTQLVDLNAAYGTTFDVLTDLLATQAQVLSSVNALPVGSVESVEGPNEADNPGQGAYYDPAFATDVPAFMRLLYATVKSNPGTANAAVIGPSFVNATSYAAVGNISAFADEGNMHNYFAGFNPGTLGWGGNGYSFGPAFYYGSIDWNMAASEQATGTEPIVATETGYSTAPIHAGVPFDVQAKYVSRLFLEQYRHHVPRTFWYQLIASDATTGDGSLGIVSPQQVPNPAYKALEGMIHSLSDGGAQSAPVNYNWSLTGQTANVDHLLLHKADGTLVIPLWIEVPSFDVNANGGLGAEIAVPQQLVTVTLGQNTKHSVLWVCNAATGAWSTKPANIVNGVISISVGDSVSILVASPH